MKPILFEGNIFGYYMKIHAYTSCLFLAAFIAFILTYYIGRKNRVAIKAILSVYLLSGIMVFVGARILNVGLNYHYYIKNPFEIITLERRGFSLYGGFIGASMTAFFLCRKNNVSFLKMADIAIPGMGIGIAFSRLGCFLNGCCYGKETTMPWGVEFQDPMLSNAKSIFKSFISFLPSVTKRHPTQIYELIAGVICAWITGWIIRKKYPDGVAFVVFTILFTLCRWINFYFRVMPVYINQVPFFYPILYMGIITLSVLVYIKIIRT